jgi:transposase
LEQKLEPRLAEAKEGKRTVYFADAAHFVFGAFLGYVWSLIRLFVPTPAGRNRYNVLGAINAITHDLTHVCNETYVNAETVCSLLYKIRGKHMDSNPVTIVLDNARYQHCALVIQLAVILDIELLFLPSYSPNLNIIERYWKWLKKDALNCKYYENFAKFKDAINNSLTKTINMDNKKELDRFLNLKFQLFDSAVYRRV